MPSRLPAMSTNKRVSRHCCLVCTVPSVVEQFSTFSSLTARFMKSAGPHCAQRFVETVGSYLDGTVRQAVYRDDDVIPSVDSYIALRRETSALRPCFVFVEFAARIDLPDEVYYHPVLSSMELAANDWVSWTNVSKITITIKSTTNMFIFSRTYSHTGKSRLLARITT